MRYVENELDQLKANELSMRAEMKQLEGSSDPLAVQSLALKKIHLKNIQDEIRKHTKGK
jgi:hypothetical protein